MTAGDQSDAVAELSDEIAVYVRGGDSVERAVNRLRRRGTIPEEVIDGARRSYEYRVGLIRDMRDPIALVETELRTGGWYDGPHPDDQLWWPVRERLARSVGSGIDGVDRASTRVVSLLRPAGSDEIRSRGLVLGYVQSGKTTSFVSVIAKAADAGYRLVIVLSGITDSLRSQTQLRLQRDLVADGGVWYWLTHADSDFAESPQNARVLLGDPHKRVLAVVKKNPARLRRLALFLDAAGESVLRECPILLVDDEADQASIDVGPTGRQSRINSLIRRILGHPKAAYVAYTATPFANLLVDPRDFQGLYPRDFIVSLDPPTSYFGAERIFGREPLDADDPAAAVDDGLDVVRHVTPDEVAAVQPPSGRNTAAGWSATVPESLARAVSWFLLATAARRVRDGGSAPSTMLIHTSMRVAAHAAVADVVRQHVADLRQRTTLDPAALDNLRTQWTAETAALPAASLGEKPVGWEDVRTLLPDVIRQVCVVVDNSQSADRLDPEETRPVIAVGGNTLARGLTLSGLVCSYFVRASNAYDTLLQMGRWFGYRPGYSDLVRVWMTEDLEAWFYDLATVEQEIRHEIRRYEIENCTPGELPVRIRTHPAMMITAAAKMRAAIVAEVSFSRSKQQTILFNHRDGGWLAHNLAATGRLLERVAADGFAAVPKDDGRWLASGVPAEAVIGFLNDYWFHDKSFKLRPDLLESYIRAENAAGALRSWNIVVVGDRTADKRTVDLGAGVVANRIHRSRLDMPNEPHANIKTLVSRIDRVADLDLSTAAAVRDAGGDDDDKLRKLREDYLGTTGLLCIYPVARDSVPRTVSQGPVRPGARRRIPLDAVDDVIGVGLFFPQALTASGVTYMSADLSAQVPEEPDDADTVDRLDRADEEAATAQELAQQQSRSGR